MKNIILLITLGLLITGCQFMPTKQGQIAVPDIHSGEKGITLAFLDNAPPSDIYEGGPFDIILKVQNAGASDVRGGMLIIGVEEQNIELISPNSERFDLAGKSVYSPEGTYDLIQFRAIAKKLGASATKSYTTTITVDACYTYQTAATATVCIDTDIFGLVKNKPCSVTTQKYSSGQGAPISVITVVPKIIPNIDPEMVTPEFTISISNPGQGDAVASEKIYAACKGQQIGAENWNAIKISATLSDQPLQCIPETITLMPGENKAVCTLPSGISKTMGTYSAPLSVVLDYGYMTKKIKTMNILKPAVT